MSHLTLPLSDFGDCTVERRNKIFVFSNEKGRIIYSPTSTTEWFREEDTNGNILHIKNANGHERWTEYNVQGNAIHFKNCDGYECWTNYDSCGRKTIFSDSTGAGSTTKYDDNDNIVYFNKFRKYECQEEWWKKYDAYGNMIYYKKSTGYTEWWKYNDNGEPVHCKDSHGFESSWHYDSDGNKIRYESSKGEILYYTSDGKSISKEEYDNIHNKTNLDNITIDGKEYKLVPIDDITAIGV